jgi:hypothetical protein
MGNINFSENSVSIVGKAARQFCSHSTLNMN